MEIEFKFCVPPDRLPALRQALAAGSTRLRLQATYFDTPDARLAAAHAALRVRRETPVVSSPPPGRQGRSRRDRSTHDASAGHWIQTAKALAQGPLVRLEDNVDLGRAQGDAVPAPDWRRHADTPVGERLAHLLGEAPLQATYGTDITRLAHRLQQGDTVVELALDEGHIQAGAATGTRPAAPRGGQRRAAAAPAASAAGDPAGTAHTLAVQELEIELVSGDVADLATVAAHWVATHGLWIDTRSKAERGEQLVRGSEPWPVVKASRLAAPAGTRRKGWQWQTLALANGLDHLLPNLQALAAGQGRVDHVHQARVALRRLRVVLREFGPLHAQGWDPDGAWTQALTNSFRELGEVRDRQVLQDLPEPLQHALAARGLRVPASAASPADAPALIAAARSGTLQQVLVALLVRAAQAQPPAVPAAAAPAAAKATGANDAAGPADDAAAPATPDAKPLGHKASRLQLQARVQHLHQQLARAAKRWPTLDADARHAVRKRAKRLRYLLELAEPLLATGDRSSATQRRYLRQLAEVQLALGAYTDALLAQHQADAQLASTAGQATPDTQAAYAAGYWLAVAQQRDAACQAPLKRLRKLKPF